MLTDRECRSAEAQGKPRKLPDQHGLYLLVSPTGHKSWKLKYRFDGKEKKLTFGPYPEVKLTEARDRMFEARALLRKGIDPARPRARPPSEAPTFALAAAKWQSLQAEGWKPKHAQTVKGRVEEDLVPILGPMPLAEIRPADILSILEKVQARGAIEIAHRLRQYASAIFDCAIALDWTETNPAASLTRGLVPARSRRYPALTKVEDCRAFLRALEAEPCQPTTRLASRLLALTAARPGNIRFAERDEFEGLDGDEPIWRIPATKMKLERALAEEEAFEFIVPLAPQAVEVLKVAIAFAARRKYLFPSSRHSHRPISENALSTNYARVPGFGGRHVPHGWRSVAVSRAASAAALAVLERPACVVAVDAAPVAVSRAASAAALAVLERPACVVTKVDAATARSASTAACCALRAMEMAAMPPGKVTGTGVRVPASVTVTGPATPHAVGTFSPVALSWPSSPGQTVL